MSEISLRDYLAKLDTLLNASAADEVIHHCRHILQYYPKNVAAYRFLGRALLLNGRWDEAAAALRRVLSVVPDDYHAHLGLSEIFDHRRKPDEAIWHLERAFEQNPNSQDLLESLRSLYRRYRNIDQARFQLTAAAVARQALRNRSYEQALDTLRDAVERQPDRADLQLLLAQALWESGSHVEAAEIALDTLQELPDCLEANRMLTALWLEEERPSDAQRYLNRVEAIDPYLAVELAQGQPAPDEAFRLEEHDYVHSLQTELTESDPDWLQDIAAAPAAQETPPADDWSNFMSSMLASSTAAPQKEQPVSGGDLFSEDWMELPQQSVSPSETVDEEEIPEEFAAFPSPSEYDELTVITPVSPTDDQEITRDEETLTWLEQAPADLFEEPFEEEEVLPMQDDETVLNIEEPDAMAWLREDLLNDEARPSRPQPNDEALAWMQNYEVEIIGEETSAIPGDQDDEAPVAENATPQDEPALQWLQDQGALDEAFGIEQLSGAEESQPAWFDENAPGEEAEAPAAEVSSEEPGAEIPLHLRGTAPLPEIPNLFDEPPSEENAWLVDASQTDAQAVPGPRRGLTALLDEANFDWMKPQESRDDIMSDAVMDEWLAQFGAEPKPAAAEDPDWLNELDTAMNDKNNLPDSSDETPEWLSASGGEAEPETPASEEELDWLTSASSGAEAQPADLPDWMLELQPGESASSSASGPDEESAAAEEFDWSSTEASTEAAVPADFPDWLAQAQPSGAYEPSSEAGAEEIGEVDIESQWLAAEEAANAPQFDESGWFDEAAIEAEAVAADEEDQPLAEESTPDWLSELSLAEQETPSEIEPTAAQPGSLDWHDELEIEAEAAEVAQEPASSDVPSWLTELQAQYVDEEQQPAEAAVVESDAETWLNELEIEAEAVETQEGEAPAVVSGVPDWLNELQLDQPQESAAVEAPAPAGVSEVDWLNQIEVEEVSAAEEAEPAAEAQDWFAEVQQEEPVAESEAAPIVEVGDVDWLNIVKQEPEPELQESPAEPVADLPDWLSEIEPVQSDQVEAIEPVSEPVAMAQEEDYAWLDEVAPEEEQLAPAETVAVEEEFGWLRELTPDTVEPETQVPEEAPVVAEYELAQPETEEEAAEYVEEPEPDADVVPSFMLAQDADDEDEYWLSEQEPEPDSAVGAELEEDVIQEPEGITTLPADELMSDEEAFEPSPASNAPDWLNAMVPGLDVDYEASEDEPIETEFLSEVPEEEEQEQREFGWVEDIIEEESRQPEPAVAEAPRRRFSFTRPPAWLSKLGRSSQSSKRDDELPDWPSDEPEWQR